MARTPSAVPRPAATDRAEPGTAAGDPPVLDHGPTGPWGEATQRVAGHLSARTRQLTPQAAGRTLLVLRPFVRSLVAAVSLVVTSTAFAGVATAAAPTATRPTVTRAVSGSVPLGRELEMTASVHAGAAAVRGVRVDLFRIVPSGRKLVTSVTTGASGTVSALVKPTSTGRWYWRFAGTAGYAASGTRVTVTVTKPAVEPLGPRVVGEAARHLGAPYVFGATGPQAFDCSGFTRYVYARLGIALPRTAADQYAAVRHVAAADRRPGDLIFFRLGGGGIDHVGIYAGGDEIIVAPKTGDHVRYEAIWTSYQVGRVA